MRYKDRSLPRMALWLVVSVIMFLPMGLLMAFIPSTGPWSLVRPLLVALPLAPAVLALRAFVHSLRAFDELERRIHLEAFAFSLACTCMLTLGYGILEDFLGWRHISMIFVLPVAGFCWLLGATRAGRRYR